MTYIFIFQVSFAGRVNEQVKKVPLFCLPMNRACNYKFTNIIFVLFLMKITTQVGRLLGYSGGSVGGGAEGAMATITGYEVSPILS